jgi:hypothetical protein
MPLRALLCARSGPPHDRSHPQLSPLTQPLQAQRLQHTLACTSLFFSCQLDGKSLLATRPCRPSIFTNTPGATLSRGNRSHKAMLQYERFILTYIDYSTASYLCTNLLTSCALTPLLVSHLKHIKQHHSPEINQKKPGRTGLPNSDRSCSTILQSAN